MCRTRSTFICDIFRIIFSLLIEIYVEDVEIENENSTAAYLDSHLTQEVLCDLLNRILSFLATDEIELLQNEFPITNFAFIWKWLETDISNAQIDLNLPMESEVQCNYDNLWLVNTSIIQELCTLLLNNFLVVNDNYSNLFCLKLLTNMGHYLSFDQISKIASKISILFSKLSRQSLYPQFSFAILRLLNSLSVSRNPAYQSGKFVHILSNLILILFQESQSCIVLRQLLLETLQNLSSSILFETFLSSIASNLKEIKEEFKLYVKYSKVKLLFVIKSNIN